MFDTEFGDIVAILYPEAAPETVDLMKTFVDEGYYVGREFNRVVPGHVIQVVDKAGGATDDARRVDLEVNASYHFSAGALGIARGNETDSGGPEFFIMDFATSHLDGGYTVWGQVIEGMDVVHRAARVDAVDFGASPAAPVGPTDRMAIDAVAIQGVDLDEVTLSGDVAAGYPLAVAENVRVGDFRHSLEWPRNLSPANESELTWYVRAYNGTALPSPGDLSIIVDNASIPVAEEPGVPGALRWRWTPPRGGDFEARLIRADLTIATLTVPV